MCRLFAFVAPQSSAVDRELGIRGIDSFLSLARLHGDGWGWSGVQEPGDAPSVHTSVASAAEDPAFGTILAADSRASMVHLRWATLGLEVEADNTHPFLVDGISFGHNGSLKPMERIKAILSSESLAAMVGQTDSEMYFSLIREKRESGLDLPAATLAAASELRRAFPSASLNAILLTADELIVVHANSNAQGGLSAEDLAEMVQLNLPDEHVEDYFALRWLRKPDGTILVGSTGVAEPDWASLPTESVITIRLASGNATHAPLLTD
ncbi:MAG: class II glutamine amidotransferase [Cryobacterium sp.]